MNSFEIIGGKQLKGEIIPQGAKNEALQVISAVLLTSEKVTIHNIPDIQDVNKLVELLKTLGVEIEKRATDTYVFRAQNIDLELLKSPDFRSKASSLRGSIMLLGPLLARFGVGYIFHNREAIKLVAAG